MKLAVIAVTEEGRKTARVLAQSLGGCKVFQPRKGALKELVGDIFNNFDALIFIMALGIVVRMIAPHLKDKHHDPAVVAVDEAKRFAVSLLSGHERGANKLSFRVAGALMAEPVITTASDTQKRIIVGVGCRRGVTAALVKSAILQALGENGIPLSEVRLAASVCIKRDEEGLISACSELEIPLIFISKNRIERFCGRVSSKIAKRYLGLKGVCEPCALLAGRKTRLIMKKKIFNQVTVAIAGEDSVWEA